MKSIYNEDAATQTRQKRYNDHLLSTLSILPNSADSEQAGNTHPPILECGAQECAILNLPSKQNEGEFEVFSLNQSFHLKPQTDKPIVYDTIHSLSTEPKEEEAKADYINQNFSAELNKVETGEDSSLEPNSNKPLLQSTSKLEEVN